MEKNHCKPSLSPEQAEALHRRRVEAGRKGGMARHPKTRYFYMDREAARAAGRKGSKISSRKGIANRPKKEDYGARMEVEREHKESDRMEELIKTIYGGHNG